MKRLFLTLAIAAIGFTGSYAQTAAHQEKHTAEQKAEKSTAKLQKELSLTADQKQKVYAIELSKFKEADGLHKSNHEAKKALKDKHEVIKKETDAKLDQVLNAGQKKKLDEIRAEKKDKKKAKKAAHQK